MAARRAEPADESERLQLRLNRMQADIILTSLATTLGDRGGDLEGEHAQLYNWIYHRYARFWQRRPPGPSL